MRSCVAVGPSDISKLLHELATDAELRKQLTELYSGELPPDVAIWRDETRLAKLSAKVQHLIEELTTLKTALGSADTTLPETAGEAMRCVERLVHPLLGVTDAAMGFFDDPTHVPGHAKLFAVLRAAERFADTLDALLAAGRAIRQGKRRFVGLTGGYETPRIEGGRSDVPSGWAAGALAAVGIDVSFPVAKKIAMGASFR